jgi:Mlc titration factor MtfA (ptsG expression regulator)
MTPLIVLILLMAAVGGFILWHSRSHRKGRETLRKRRLDPRERAMVIEAFPLWEVIPDEIRAEAEGWMRVFMAEKNFEACGGLEAVTEEMQLAIAAPACLLIAKRPQDYYERLRSILIYPDAFTVREDGFGEEQRLGESWITGSVVLSWQSVMQGDANVEDGLNVVLHEFAHQLDQSDGEADGLPELEESEDVGQWSRVFRPAYQGFCERVNAGKRSVIDDYGAESPAEFFAVVTETFFERPQGLRREEPEVYAELVHFYGMDPASWD